MKKIFACAVTAVLLTGCSSSSTSTDSTLVTSKESATTVLGSGSFEYTVTVGENTGVDVVIDVVQGAQVVLNVVNPNSHDDIHLHGYDLSTGSLEKGEIGTMTFQATQVGDFEIESHESQELVSILRVSAP
ncbi:MAG: hypothetical protein ACK45J_02025 [Acidimicrobiaceae bacterium]|jgi:uncharacterized protein YcfL|nr:hypothetical protein [Ilumatobacteraceae bacterium]